MFLDDAMLFSLVYVNSDLCYLLFEKSILNHSCSFAFVYVSYMPSRARDKINFNLDKVYLS